MISMFLMHELVNLLVGGGGQGSKLTVAAVANATESQLFATDLKR